MLSGPNAQRQQLTQQNAIRIAQAQMSRNAGNTSGVNPAQLSPGVIQKFLVAAKNGNVDLSNPALQQFKNLLMLQQQQKQVQVAINPAANSAAKQYVPSVEQSMQTNMSQPRQQQQALPNHVSTNPSVLGQVAPSNQAVKLWSGDIAWVMNNPAGQQNCRSESQCSPRQWLTIRTVRIAVETYSYGATNPQDVQLEQWPSGEQIKKLSLIRQSYVWAMLSSLAYPNCKLSPKSIAHHASSALPVLRAPTRRTAIDINNSPIVCIRKGQ